jgi:hypothetical protein
MKFHCVMPHFPPVSIFLYSIPSGCMRVSICTRKLESLDFNDALYTRAGTSCTILSTSEQHEYANNEFIDKFPDNHRPRRLHVYGIRTQHWLSLIYVLKFCVLEIKAKSYIPSVGIKKNELGGQEFWRSSHGHVTRSSVTVRSQNQKVVCCRLIIMYRKFSYSQLTNLTRMTENTTFYSNNFEVTTNRHKAA